ncbi:MAG: hypothetical protein DBX07_07740 [Candidatus Poseidoniales archaeon]|nr:MAG: hypothetical protein DBX07_07740 [Candidatus Poseidoniales archaeon]
MRKITFGTASIRPFPTTAHYP